MLDRLIVRGTDKGFCRKIDLIIWIPFYPSYVLMLYIRHNQNINRLYYNSEYVLTRLYTSYHFRESYCRSVEWNKVADVTISLYIFLYIFNMNYVLCKRRYSAIKDIKKYQMHISIWCTWDWWYSQVEPFYRNLMYA